MEEDLLARKYFEREVMLVIPFPLSTMQKSDRSACSALVQCIVRRFELVLPVLDDFISPYPSTFPHLASIADLIITRVATVPPTVRPLFLRPRYTTCFRCIGLLVDDLCCWYISITTTARVRNCSSGISIFCICSRSSHESATYVLNAARYCNIDSTRDVD